MGLGAVVPFVLKSLVQNIQTGNYADLPRLFLIIISACLIQQIIFFFLNYSLNTLEYIIAHDKRNELLEQILNSALYKKHKVDSTLIINRLLTEVSCYGTLIGVVPVMITANIIAFIVSAVVLCGINLYLFIFCCFFIPFIFGLTHIIRNHIQRSALEQRKKYEHLLMRLTETLNAFNSIKIMKAENQLFTRFAADNKTYLAQQCTSFIYERLAMDLNMILFSTLPILCLLCGLYLVMSGRSDIGSAVAFYMYIGFFVIPITSFSNMRIKILQGNKQREMIEEIMRNFEAVRLENTADISIDSLSPNTITINKIYYDYNDAHIMFNQEISFLKPGLYYVNGKSGAGKSTILKIIGKVLYSPESNITIGELPLNDIPERNYFNVVTYLDAAPSFFTGTVEENITFFGKYTIRTDVLNRFFNVDEDILLDKELQPTQGMTLSTGQLQRLNLLRLIVKNKEQKIIILDEALSGVDMQKEEEIITFLRGYFEDAFIFIVSHRESTKRLCDYHIHVDTGTITLVT